VVIRLGGEAVKVGQALGYDLEHITGLEPGQLLAASEGDAKALSEVGAHMDKQTSSQARSNFQRPSMAQDMQERAAHRDRRNQRFIVQKAKEAAARRRRTRRWSRSFAGSSAAKCRRAGVAVRGLIAS